MKKVQDACGRFSNCSRFVVEKICALSAQEATGASSGGASSDAAYYTASPRPLSYATLLRLSL